jgi:hypothetical protein
VPGPFEEPAALRRLRPQRIDQVAAKASSLTSYRDWGWTKSWWCRGFGGRVGQGVIEVSCGEEKVGGDAA